MSEFNYQGIPEEAIPATGTKFRKALDLYMTGEEVTEQCLCDTFGHKFRSVHQALRGDKYLHWNLISVKGDDGNIYSRYLDQRHLSGNREEDALARAERKKELKAQSHQEAMLGASRVTVAFEELEEARQKHSDLTNKSTVKKNDN